MQDNFPRDETLCDSIIQESLYTVRMRIHKQTEKYYGDELVPLSHKRGEKVYLQAQLYILVPQFIITAVLDTQSDQFESNIIGHTVSSDWSGMTHQQIATAQAWYYPEDKLLVLWEIVLSNIYHQNISPNDNQILLNLWKAFEAFLQKEFTQTTRIITERLGAALRR